ncbi:MAG: insulinase family protein [Bacteroidales bacterium]|nr:insulinase family protein [Bacteroidales bacterium]
MEYYIHKLKNGIKLIHKPSLSPVAHCGIIINTGARDESDSQLGMAHFIEHLIFKGTNKRKAHHILSRMEDVGGEINAYTTKEETCIQVSFFNNYYDRAFELISDMIFNSVFPDREIFKEKVVILDEINSYKDSPYEQLYDDFEEIIFKGNPVARNILGTEKSLNSYGRNDLLKFYQDNYPTNEMIVSSVGNVSLKIIVVYFEKYFSDISEKKRKIPRQQYDLSKYSPIKKKSVKNTYQAHCIIGNQAFGNLSEKRYALHLLNNLLGGPGMNSRLNMNLRERKGLAYNVESNYTTYSDTGIINIYFGTNKIDVDKCIKLTHGELKILRQKLLGTVQLARAKRQLIGQIAIGAESNESQMISNGRSLLLYNRIESLSEINNKIEAISAKQIRDVTNEIFNPDCLSYLIYE